MTSSHLPVRCDRPGGIFPKAPLQKKYYSPPRVTKTSKEPRCFQKFRWQARGENFQRFRWWPENFHLLPPHRSFHIPRMFSPHPQGRYRPLWEQLCQTVPDKNKRRKLIPKYKKKCLDFSKWRLMIRRLIRFRFRAKWIKIFRFHLPIILFHRDFTKLMSISVLE